MSPVAPHIATKIITGLLVIIVILLSLFFFDDIRAWWSFKSIVFEVIDEGANSAFLERKNFIIRSSEEWKDLWFQVHGESSRMPQVDFSSYVVLALFQGQKPSGGYEVSVESIFSANKSVEVSILEKEPGSECQLIEAFTAPYQLVVVKKFEGELVSKTERLQVSCDA